MYYFSHFSTVNICICIHFPVCLRRAYSAYNSGILHETMDQFCLHLLFSKINKESKINIVFYNSYSIKAF